MIHFPRDHLNLGSLPQQIILNGSDVLLLLGRLGSQPDACRPDGDGIAGWIKVIPCPAKAQVCPVNAVGFGNTAHIHPCPYVSDIRTGIRLIHNGQFHTCDAVGQFCDPGRSFPQQISRQCHILPDLGRPDPANLFHRFLIVHIVLPIVYRCNIQPGIRLGFVALLIGLGQFRSQRDQGRHPLRVVTGDLHIRQVLPKLHRLQ